MLQALELLAMTATACRAAAVGQGVLADARVDGRHQGISPGDLLIAATAEDHSVGVLHYDADFDVLANEGIFSFESRWIASTGALP